MENRIAVVGAGFWGKNLVRNFFELGALHIICDANRELGDRYTAQYPDVKFAHSFTKVLDDPEVCGVSIATPASSHYQMVKEALVAGKHVLVEKPLSLKVDQGEELISLARKQGLILMVGHILRYHPAVRTLKGLIDEGELGKIQYLYSNRLNIGKIRSEENILWSFAPHDISVILFLLNECPRGVYATGGSYVQQQIPDVTMTTMDFKSGVNAHVFVSWLHPFKEQKLVVVGDKKMAVFDDISERKLLLYPHIIEWKERIPVAGRAEAENIPVELKEPLEVECRHFLECIEKNRTPDTDGEEGLRVLRVLQAFQESLNDNGSRIELHTLHQSEKQEYFVHESSYIDEDVRIGKGTRIWHFSHVLKGSSIGMDCRIGQNVVVGPHVSVGNGCKIQNNISIYEGVKLEEQVFCGPSMVFTNVFNPRSAIPRMDELKPTLVKRGATIGANATIVCGHTIGQYAFIGAGAVVTKDVPDYALIIGNPGEIVGWMCECGVKLNFDAGEARCGICDKRFEKRGDRVERKHDGNPSG